MNDEMTGRFMTLGIDFIMGTTEMDILGRPMNVKSAVFKLKRIVV